MAFFSSAGPIQDWLEDTKLLVTLPLEEGIETLAVQRVLGALARRYVVTTWVSDVTTPNLVTKIIAMLYTAAFYRRQYSEDLGNNPAWPVWLETTALNTLNQIASGQIDLVDPAVIEVSTGQQSPIFYPNDVSSETDPAAFQMQQVF